TYAAFMRLYLQAYHGFCDAKGDCLVMPTWNHMWFVAYLWVYSVWLWGLLKLWPSALDALARMAGRRLAGWGLLLWPIALLALVRCTLVGRFPQTHALVDDFYNHALYLSVFLLGAVLARWNGWAGFERWRWGALVASLLLWAVITGYFAYYNGDVEPPDWLRQLQRVGYGALQWLAIAAALGFAHRHWNRDHRWRATVVEAVFPVYLLHQTVIILLARWLRPWQLAPAAEAPLLIAGTALACVAGYLVAARLGPLRVLFGLAARRRTGSALAAPAASSA
ncbi:MAG TPA: acyltransferase family protein, partial [Ideonella sp.]|nr:acyltransferase family protein [Ideonella sp.]